MQQLSPPPPKLKTDGAWNFGAYCGELLDAINLAKYAQQESFAGFIKNKLRQKNWVWLGLYSDRFFSGFSVAQLGYVGQAFGYACDTRTVSKKKLELNESSWLSPAGLGMGVSGSLHNFRSFAISPKAQISFVRKKEILQVKIKLPKIEGELQIGPFYTPLSVLSEFEPAGITMKTFSTSVNGRLYVDDQPIPLENMQAAWDWTSSFFHYRTDWKWALGVGHDKNGNSISFNLCTGVHEDLKRGFSECALWINGRLAAVPFVRVQIGHGTGLPWRIYSDDGRVEIEFTPVGERAANTDLGIVSSYFRQPFGQFSGRIRDYLDRSVEFSNVLGVVEDHKARW
ncbi:MAG: DUF2804 domain-containing protein [Bacteriovoracia bacterium]